MYQFCVGAAKGVLSPFVLQEIIMDALQRLNPAHVHAHLRTPAFHQLVQRCQQAYLQVWVCLWCWRGFCSAVPLELLPHGLTALDGLPLILATC